MLTLTFSIEDCSDICTGVITSLQINAHKGTPLQTLTDGQVFADLTSAAVRIRALVEGEHESFFLQSTKLMVVLQLRRKIRRLMILVHFGQLIQGHIR